MTEALLPRFRTISDVPRMVVRCSWQQFNQLVSASGFAPWYEYESTSRRVLGSETYEKVICFLRDSPDGFVELTPDL